MTTGTTDAVAPHLWGDPIRGLWHAGHVDRARGRSYVSPCRLGLERRRVLYLHLMDIALSIISPHLVAASEGRGGEQDRQ